jgi:hypothetical protein
VGFRNLPNAALRFHHVDTGSFLVRVGRASLHPECVFVIGDFTNEAIEVFGLPTIQPSGDGLCDSPGGMQRLKKYQTGEKLGSFYGTKIPG